VLVSVTEVVEGAEVVSFAVRETNLLFSELKCDRKFAMIFASLNETSVSGLEYANWQELQKTRAPNRTAKSVRIVGRIIGNSVQ